MLLRSRSEPFIPNVSSRNKAGFAGVGPSLDPSASLRLCANRSFFFFFAPSRLPRTVPFPFSPLPPAKTTASLTYF
jgi:hypothetical protein